MLARVKLVKFVIRLWLLPEVVAFCGHSYYLQGFYCLAFLGGGSVGLPWC